MAKTNKALISKIENFAISLMDAAQGNISIPGGADGTIIEVPVSIAEQVKVFESVIKYTQMINRLEDDEDDSGGIGDLARQLREQNSTPSRRIRRAPDAPAEAAPDPDSDDESGADFRNGTSGNA